MELVKWRDAYNTGINMFDEEHRRLVTMINRLYTALRQGEEEPAVKAILQELIDYTREHFAHEEELMERYRYPELDAHRFEHNSFRSTIRDISRMVDHGIDGMGRPLLQMLRDWLLHHIQEIDGRYGRFFREQEL